MWIFVCSQVAARRRIKEIDAHVVQMPRENTGIRRQLAFYWRCRTDNTLKRGIERG